MMKRFRKKTEREIRREQLKRLINDVCVFIHHQLYYTNFTKALDPVKLINIYKF